MLFQSTAAIMVSLWFFLVLSTCSFAWTTGETGTGSEGWALDDSGRKFFAIGLWGIPGYTFTRGLDEPAGNENAFREQTSPFNLLIVQSGFQKPYMFRNETVFMAGCSEFNWSFSEKGYTGPVPLPPNDIPPNGAGVSFNRMQSIMKQLDALKPYIRRTIVDPARDAYRNTGFIHFIMDEPDRGQSGWYWPPELIQAYHDIVREDAPGQLTFIDLGGTISANRYFYETLFGPGLKTGTNPDRGECFPGDMSTYDYTFDGTSLYEYRRGLFGRGRWVERPDSAFAYAFFENVSRTSKAYRNASDIIGVNSYGVFRDYPETAGEVVDAIRNGCGPAKPVWLFYDASAAAKPRGMSYEEYAGLIRCQVYTAIIHGSTGVLFYAFDLNESAIREYWPFIFVLARALDEQRVLFELPETGRSRDTAYHRPGYDHIHYSIRTDPRGTRFLIASNTDRNAAHTIAVEGFPERELSPLGVAVVTADGSF